MRVLPDWEEFLWDRYEETGDLADVLLQKPFLEEHQERLLAAFLMLAPDRPLGVNGAGFLSTVAVFAMADEIGEERMDFLSLCRELDGVYLENVRRSNK